MKSIKSKLLKNSLIVIITTILILDITTILCLRAYYYKNTEAMLENQIDTAINFYNKYFATNELIENIYNNVDAFWDNPETQIEVLDDKGNLLMDSKGIRDEKILKTSDIAKALSGEFGVWSGRVDFTKEKVMIVSKSISSKVEPNKVVGVLRVIYSLAEVERTIDIVVVLFLVISIVVIFIGIIMSSIIAKEITNPIKNITNIAKKMAEGNLTIRSNINDNSEIEQLSNTLNYMAEEVENRERLKNEFISSVSHELRTPLTAIKGWAITLRYDYSDTDTIALGLDIIEKESDRLTEMVEELLDFSKLVNGVVSLNKKQHDIEAFVRYLENYMAPRANREGKKFSVILDNDLGECKFDDKRMKQVLINIIDNAFKFTEEGSEIKLSVSKNKDNLYFVIEDNGIGIDKDDIPKVKEKFFKGKNSKSRNGIGLSICDEIVKLHGGEIIIKSKIKKGTTVSIEIPFREGDKHHE